MSTNPLRIILLLCIILNLLCCKRNGAVTVKKFAIKKTTAKKLHDSSNTVIVQTDFPTDTVYPARILTAGGVFHGDEVEPQLATAKWQGLFKTDSGYYIADTKIKISKAYDAVLDNEGQKTGWEVKPKIKDTAILLVAGINQLHNGDIKDIKLSKTELLPGEQQQFTYNNIEYTLYATGIKKTEKPDNKDYQVSNYKLFIKAIIDGQTYNQLLVSISNFDGTLTSILFAGDMDGDHIPDFIIDTTADENQEVPTLYLSSPAKKGTLLKVMGMHLTTGC